MAHTTHTSHTSLKTPPNATIMLEEVCHEGAVCANNSVVWPLAATTTIEWQASDFGNSDQNLLINLHPIEWTSTSNCMGAQMDSPVLLSQLTKNTGSQSITIPSDFRQGGPGNVFSIRVFAPGVNCLWGPVSGKKYIEIAAFQTNLAAVNSTTTSMPSSSPSVPPSSNDDNNTSASSSLSKADIAGIVVGSLAALFFLLFLVYFLLQRLRRRSLQYRGDAPIPPMAKMPYDPDQSISTLSDSSLPLEREPGMTSSLLVPPLAEIKRSAAASSKTLTSSPSLERPLSSVLSLPKQNFRPFSMGSIMSSPQIPPSPMSVSSPLAGTDSKEGRGQEYFNTTSRAEALSPYLLPNGSSVSLPSPVLKRSLSINEAERLKAIEKSSKISGEEARAIGDRFREELRAPRFEEWDKDS